MPRIWPAPPEVGHAQPAAVFAALGDPTRLDLLARLSGGAGQSITSLAAGAAVSRQAITKHLRVLEGAGIATRRRLGRESVFELRPEALREAEGYLRAVSAQWDGALGRLKAMVEG